MSNYKKANTASKELMRGCFIVGAIFALGALYMIWFGGAV